MRVLWVRSDQLGEDRLDRLGDGGQGVVHGLARPPDGLRGMRLAYKRYKVAFDTDVLHDMCGFLDLLRDRDRAFLEPRLAWPAALVYEGSPPTALPPSANPDTKVVGFLMRRVTGAFEFTSPRLGRTTPRGLEFLLNDDAYTAKIGLQVDDGQRLRLLTDLARTLDRLHRQGVTVGDLSPKNIVFTPAGRGRCLLIDCDSMRYRGRDVLTQVETTGWEVPEEEEKATVASDSLKLGLVALRIFNRSQDSGDVGPLRGVSAELAALAARSLSEEPHRRPTPADWLSVLETVGDRWTVRRSPAGPRRWTGSYATAAGAPRPQGEAGPAAPGVTTPGRGTAGAGRVVAALVAVQVVLLVLLGHHVTRLLASAGGPDGSPAPGAGGGPHSTTTSASGPGAGSKKTDESPSPLAGAPGAAVDYARVAGHPEAREVAETFARFFGAVNTRDYDTALSFYDPASPVYRLESQAGRDQWKKAMSTTKDSDLVLGALDTSGEHTLATLSFRSRQSPGYGPAARPNDTCGDWRVTYQLTYQDGYRIHGAPWDGVHYEPC
ncbi:protein kinase family protein [Streptomyces ruber]|uniref:protein kinase family protein n=1 Tax=Streptomyces ruber TaxID=83378 RepID=UPI001670AF26|nr:protein kinase family protein [Streptomyces ruber]